MPPVGIEPTTPGLRDQCSASELQRLGVPVCKGFDLKIAECYNFVLWTSFE